MMMAKKPTVFRFRRFRFLFLPLRSRVRSAPKRPKRWRSNSGKILVAAVVVVVVVVVAAALVAAC